MVYLSKELLSAITRLAGTRHSDGVSTLVSSQDRETILEWLYSHMRSDIKPDLSTEKLMGAVRAERERCAKIVEDYESLERNDGAYQDAEEVQEILAKAIRGTSGDER